MMELLEGLAHVLDLFDGGLASGIGIVVSLGTIIGGFMLMRKKYKRFKTKVNNLYDSVAGSEAILDPETGKVLREERLSIGNRVAVMEEWQARTITTLEKIASTMDKQTELETKMVEIADRQQQHEEWSEKWIREHDATASEREKKIWEALATQPKP